jgi:hypothetical protein
MCGFPASTMNPAANSQLRLSRPLLFGADGWAGGCWYNTPEVQYRERGLYRL